MAAHKPLDQRDTKLQKHHYILIRTKNAKREEEEEVTNPFQDSVYILAKLSSLPFS